MKAGMESLGRVRTQAVVLLLLAFLAGAFGGGALERVMLHRAARAHYGSGRGSGGGSQANGAPRSANPMDGFYKWLNVTDAQRTQIDAIFAKRRPHLDSLDSIRRTAMDSARKEMDAVLTADQRAKLDSSMAGRGRSGRGGYGPPGRYNGVMRGDSASASKGARP